MNQKGRDFITAKVKQLAHRERERLEKELPKVPSWEFELIADIMKGGDAGLRSREDIIKSLRKSVGKGRANRSHYGNRQQGISFDDRQDYYDAGEDLDESRDAMTCSPWIFFNPPEAFKEKMIAYREANAIYRQKVQEINRNEEMLLMKIAVGSDKMLAPLVMQVDATGGSISLANESVLMIGDGK